MPSDIIDLHHLEDVCFQYHAQLHLVRTEDNVISSLKTPSGACVLLNTPERGVKRSSYVRIFLASSGELHVTAVSLSHPSLCNDAHNGLSERWRVYCQRSRLPLQLSAWLDREKLRNAHR